MWSSLGVNLARNARLSCRMASSVAKRNVNAGTNRLQGPTGESTRKRNVQLKLDGGRSESAFGTRPKSTIGTVPDRSISPSRKLTTSTSAGNVNANRNVRHRRLGSSQSDAGITKAFQRLSVQDKRPSANAQTTRHSSSASGSGRGTSSHVCKSLEDVARWILTKKCQHIVVMAGAGISTPSGIPDFRTPGSGLYDNLQQYNIPYPEAIFDIGFFHRDPRPFFALARELYPGNYRPNYVHYFVRMLHDKGLLLRMYTQNIDGLERIAGIPAAKLVEAHGTFAMATCTRCDQKYDGQETKVEIMADKIPLCKERGCRGKVKPDIVFFGEDLPKRFFYYLKDFAQCDLVIVMGTSLEVQPFAGIINSARGYVPRLLINREAVGPFARPRSGRYNDVAVTGDLVECVQRFARILGWKKAMQDLIQEHKAALDEEFGPRTVTGTPSQDGLDGNQCKTTPDSKPVSAATGPSTNHQAGGGFRGYRANSCQSMEALKGHSNKEAVKPPAKNLHTVSETTTSLLPLAKSLPSAKEQQSACQRLALPRLPSRQSKPTHRSGQRGTTSWRSDTSDSSDTSESSTESDTSDD